jgi:hypothetical protein
VASRRDRRAGFSASPWSRWTAQPLKVTSGALEQAADRNLRGATEISYARIGANDDGHAAFLDDRFDLACPRFHQYPFTRTRDLDSVLRCIEEKKPRLIVTTPFFGGARSRRIIAFMDQARRLLRRDYRRVEHRTTSFGTGDVWLR